MSKQWKNGGKKYKQLKPLGIVWNEAIQGRFDEDVASAVHKCLRDPQYREANHIIIRADNCTGQLKNWTLYASLVYEVNNHATIESVTIKYFEKGHSFMSADSFHARVESSIRQMKCLYTFDDFVRSIRKYGIATEMREGDFIDYKNQLSNAKDTNYPYLVISLKFNFVKGQQKCSGRKLIQALNLNAENFFRRSIVKVSNREISYHAKKIEE